MSEMVGREFGGIRVLEELAVGGMGIVYRGEFIEDGVCVAVKVLHDEISQNRKEIGRFIREAVIYKKLVHPNLLRFYSFGFEAGVGFYLVTEFLKGQELGEYLSEFAPGKTMELDKALDIALQICAGLSAAHAEGVVHRDLKPSNVFLAEQEDGSEVAKVFDFGIGKLMEQEVSGKLTMVGETLGTPLYMAPEQIRDTENIGTWTDLYALGVMLFQMLTGRLPFTGDTPIDILAGHLKKTPPLLRKHNRFMAGTELEGLVHSLLTKEWLDRPSSVNVVKERLWQSKKLLAPETLGATMAMPMFDPSVLEAIQQAAEVEKEERTNVSARIAGSDTQIDLTAVPFPEPETERPVAVLLLQTREGEEEVGWLLPGECLSVGSEPGSDVHIRGKDLEKQHAELYCNPQRWITIQSLEKAVLRVNGAVVASAMLQDGDRITLGAAEVRVQFFS